MWSPVESQGQQQNLILVLGETATMKGPQRDPSTRLRDGLQGPRSDGVARRPPANFHPGTGDPRVKLATRAKSDVCFRPLTGQRSPLGEASLGVCATLVGVADDVADDVLAHSRSTNF